MRIGVNYIPSENWLFRWIDFDQQKVRDDLCAIKKIGFDHIRAHLLWSFFQLNENQMCDHCMKNLKKFVKICEEEKIDFFLSLFTGWMSGYSFFPAFIGREDNFSMFQGERVTRAEEFYVREIASVVSESPSFLGFDLGNELSWIGKLDRNSSILDKDNWASYMFKVCEKYAPGKMHSNGVDHLPWFWEKGFTRDNLANQGKITSLHSWTLFTGALERSGLLGIHSLNIAPYMIELARAYSKDINRQFWVQEIGCSPIWAEGKENLIEKYIEDEFAILSKVNNLWGVTWWCSHDISREFTDFPNLEYNLGILTYDNKEKPYAIKFKEIIKKYSKMNVCRDDSNIAMLYKPEIEDDSGWVNPERYMQLVKNGINPCIILPKYKDDISYLRTRNIKRIINI